MHPISDIVDGVRRMDLATGIFFASHSQEAPTFNHALWILGTSSFFKLTPVMAAIWWIWFHRTDERSRLAIVAAFCSMVLAGAVGRLVQDLGPQRLRPLHSGIADYVVPAGVPGDVLEHWSSFPSDHSCISFALCAGVFLASRRLGLLSYLWVFFMVCLPRVYFAYHYLSDFLAGIVIGTLSAVATYHLLSRFDVVARLQALSVRSRLAYRAGCLVLCYETLTLFDGIRSLSAYVVTHGLHALA